MKLYNNKFSKKANNTFYLREKFHTEKIIELVQPRKNDIILDIGCNQGKLVKVFRSFTRTVYGCDINREAIKNSKIKGLRVMFADKLEYDNNLFDKIVSSHVIEHIPNLKGSLVEIKRALKPNGICVLIYPFEIFRGSNNLIEAWNVYNNPLYSRKLHIHKLCPKKIRKLTDMQIINDGFFLGPYPTYFTVLKKA